MKVLDRPWLQRFDNFQRKLALTRGLSHAMSPVWPFRMA